MDTLNILTQFGTAGATVYIVIVFIKYIAKRDDDLNKIVGNHLSHNTEALNKLSSVIDKLFDKLK